MSCSWQGCLKVSLAALAPLCLLVSCGADPAPTGLEARLAPLAKAHKGKVAIAVKHLETGESYCLNADEVMPTASLIKLAVLVEVYQQAGEGKLKLTDRVTLKTEDKVPGSGILTNHFSDGANISLRDATRLMIAFSDNTATNLVLDKTGIVPVNERMEAWGFPNTKINAKVFRGSTTSVNPERTKRYGLGSTTAREMVGLLEELQTGQRCPPASKQAILQHLKKNEDKDKFKRLLPAGTAVAHKDGSVNDSRTDAGIVWTPTGPVAVCVLTTANEDQRWAQDNAGDVLCAKVAREVYDHFAPAAKTNSGD
jgi:beta-lactamase class A